MLNTMNIRSITSCNSCGAETYSDIAGPGRLCEGCQEEFAIQDNACKHGDHNFVECDEHERTCSWCGKCE